MALIKREYTDHETVVTAENMNAIQDSIIALEDGLFSVDSDKSGNIITITDASKRGFRSLNIYGKTTQNGTPTPDAPVKLVSAGDAGSVSLLVGGKNLWNHANDMADMSSLSNWGSPIWKNATVVATLKPKTTYTMKCKVTCLSVPNHSTVFSDQLGFVLHSSKDTANHKYMAASIGGGVLKAGEQRTLQGTFTTPDNLGDAAMEYRVLYYTQRFIQEDGTAVFATIKVDDVQLENGATASDYAPYTGQKLTISTPNGLPGVPVTSDGNYTDANGQQWICDEIDFARGVYLKRCMKLSANQLISFHYFELTNCARVGCNLTLKSVNYANGLSTHLPQVSNYTIDTPHFYVENSALWIFAPMSELTERSKDGVTAWANRLGVEFVYALETPIETRLTENELAAYVALHTYKDHTTVSNDAGAWMDLEYVMDAKKYIDSLVGSGGGSIIPATVE